MREHKDEKGHHSPAKSKVAMKMRGEHHKKHHEGAKAKKMEKVMREFAHHELRSGSKHGPKVKSRKQAIAIGMSEARHKKHKKH